VIPRIPFGSTGHSSTRLIFGAAALFRATEREAGRCLEHLLEAGVNHIDVAASYGHAELRVGAWMPEHRAAFFLATKTGDRDYATARDSIRRSLDRLRVNHIDLIQLHNLVAEDDWSRAFSEDGALRACIEARDQGLVRFIGVTGHGNAVAERHRASLEQFAFDSVLLPYNRLMMDAPAYAASFEALLVDCARRGVAVQTIKAIARRRWPEGSSPNQPTWYEPFVETDDIRRAVHWALARPGIFVNSASDLELLPALLDAAQSFEPEAPAPEAALRHQLEASDARSLWIPSFARP